MKKAIFIFFLVFLAGKAYSQAGDLTIGALGGYESKYKNILYGLNLSYNVTDPLQISLSALMNPNMTEKAEYDWDKDEKLKLYSTNLDVRFFLLNMDTWAMGPSIGAQYLIAKFPDNDLKDYNAWGANIGWHIRINPTDNLRLNGGWRYSTAQEGASYHFFYLGVGYAFNLF